MSIAIAFSSSCNDSRRYMFRVVCGGFHAPTMMNGAMQRVMAVFVRRGLGFSFDKAPMHLQPASFCTQHATSLLGRRGMSTRPTQPGRWEPHVTRVKLPIPTLPVRIPSGYSPRTTSPTMWLLEQRFLSFGMSLRAT